MPLHCDDETCYYKLIEAQLLVSYIAKRGALFEALFEPLNNQLHWHWPNYQLATLCIIRRSKINARINQAMLRALTGHSFSLSTVASRSCKLLNQKTRNDKEEEKKKYVMPASIAKCEGTLTSVPTDGGSERTRQQEDEKTDSTTFSFSQDIKRMLLSMHNFLRYLRAPEQRSESRLPSDSRQK